MDMHDRTWDITTSTPTPGSLLLKLSGNWCIECHLPTVDSVSKALADHPDIVTLKLDTEAINNYDSGLVIWLLKLEKLCDARKITLDTTSLPKGVQHLLRLSKEIPPHGIVHTPEDKTLLGRLGFATVKIWHRAWELIDLIGAAVLGSGRFLIGRSIFLRRDILLFIQDNGPDAMLIVGVMAFLMGITLALISTMQLEKFGTEIYIANIEVVGILREIGVLMTGVIMAGRTSAAYAAEIGSMKADGEIDALHTLAISGIDFLVMPRIIASVITLPLLVILTDVLGNLGGLFFTTTFLDITYLEYITQAREAFELKDFFIGIGKGVLFGYLIAIAGCLRGLQCGRTAASVGNAAMSAVLLGLILILGCNTAVDIMLFVLKV